VPRPQPVSCSATHGQAWDGIPPVLRGRVTDPDPIRDVTATIEGRDRALQEQKAYIDGLGRRLDQDGIRATWMVTSAWRPCCEYRGVDSADTSLADPRPGPLRSLDR